MVTVWIVMVTVWIVMVTGWIVMVTVWIVMVTGCFVAQCPGLGQHGEGSGANGGPDHCEEWGQVGRRAHRYVTIGVEYG